MGGTATAVGAATLIGQPAPPFTLQDQDGRWVSLGDLLANGPIVLTFYPIDFSPVCTRQLCDYRDSYDAIRSMGARIVGISPDPPGRHREFITGKRLPFQLLSDPDRQVFRAYGVVPRWLAIRTRGLFVIGRDGRVLEEHVEPTMFTHRRAADVLGMLRDVKDQL
jgi:peroxiredoxin Q/BCP